MAHLVECIKGRWNGKIGECTGSMGTTCFRVRFEDIQGDRTIPIDHLIMLTPEVARKYYIEVNRLNPNILSLLSRSIHANTEPIKS